MGKITVLYYRVTSISFTLTFVMENAYQDCGNETKTCVFIFKKKKQRSYQKKTWLYLLTFAAFSKEILWIEAVCDKNPTYLHITQNICMLGLSALPSATSFEQNQCLSSSLTQHSAASVIHKYHIIHIIILNASQRRRKKLGAIVQRTG